MGDKHVLLHQNHGIIVTANSVSRAFDRLYFLEQAARIANKALAMGRPLKIVSDQVRRQVYIGRHLLLHHTTV